MGLERFGGWRLEVGVGLGRLAVGGSPLGVYREEVQGRVLFCSFVKAFEDKSEACVGVQARLSSPGVRARSN